MGIFLEYNFKSALEMMLPVPKTSLGGHCFRYADIVAGEFYFDAANDAIKGCGCNRPVTDVLNLAKHLESPKAIAPTVVAAKAVTNDSTTDSNVPIDVESVTQAAKAAAKRSTTVAKASRPEAKAPSPAEPTRAAANVTTEAGSSVAPSTTNVARPAAKPSAARVAKVSTPEDKAKAIEAKAPNAVSSASKLPVVATGQTAKAFAPVARVSVKATSATTPIVARPANTERPEIIAAVPQSTTPRKVELVTTSAAKALPVAAAAAQTTKVAAPAAKAQVAVSPKAKVAAVPAVSAAVVMEANVVKPEAKAIAPIASKAPVPKADTRAKAGAPATPAKLTGPQTTAPATATTPVSAVKPCREAKLDVSTRIAAAPTKAAAASDREAADAILKRLHSDTAAATAESDAAAGIMSLQDLQNPRTWRPKGVDPYTREFHLADEEFQQTFGMSKDDWAKVPKWKKDAAKKKIDLF